MYKKEFLNVTFNTNELMLLGLTKYEELGICENKVISIGKLQEYNQCQL